MYVPDNRLAEAKCCDRRYQTGTNAIGVNQIRLDADDFFPQFADGMRKRFEVSN